MQEQPEKKSITVEEVDAINPEHTALAWENFLKRLVHDMREDEARGLLVEELREFLNKKEAPANITLWASAQISVGQLKLYLLGELDASSLRTYEELAGGEHSKR